MKPIKKLFSRKTLICQHCNTKNYPHHKFCEGCGKKLEAKVVESEIHKKHKIEHLHKEEHTISGEKHIKSHKISPYLIPWAIFSVIIIITSVVLLPTKVVSYQVEVPYIETEQYTIEVPYEGVEEYIVQVPYETAETYIESVPYTEQEPYTVTECAFVGLFCKDVTYYRIVTKYKDVIKTRSVIKYRDETQYQTITKTRTETREREVRKTRTETRQKEVNWIFAFDALIRFRKLG